MTELEKCLNEPFTQGAIAMMGGGDYGDNPWSTWTQPNHAEWIDGFWSAFSMEDAWIRNNLDRFFNDGVNARMNGVPRSKNPFKYERYAPYGSGALVLAMLRWYEGWDEIGKPVECLSLTKKWSDIGETAYEKWLRETAKRRR